MPILIDLGTELHLPGLLGGKGEQLNRMKRAGVRVPRGFVLTTEAQILALSENGLTVAPSDEIIRAGEQSLLAWSQQQSQSVLRGVCPLPILSAIHCGITSMTSPFVVRSSGDKEDAGRHSWSGMFDSVLRSNPDLVSTDFMNVLASNYSQRSVLYRERLGVTKQPTAWMMAVVIQEMIEPLFAGALISRNPRHDRGDSWMLVEMVKGLGSELLSGSVNPGRYLVDRQTGEVVPDNQSALSSFSCGSSDTNDLIGCFDELRRMALQIENIFTTPVNIEWCVDKSGVWALQARSFRLYDAPKKSS